MVLDTFDFTLFNDPLFPQCLSSNDLLHLARGNSTAASGFHSEDFFKVAAGLVYYLSDPSEACAAIMENQWARGTDHFIQSIRANNSVGHSFDLRPTELHDLLYKIQSHNLPAGKDQVGRGSACTVLL